MIRIENYYRTYDSFAPEYNGFNQNIQISETCFVNDKYMHKGQ